MTSVAFAVGLLALGSGAGWVAGRLLHRKWPGQVVDGVQGGVGALLCLEVFALTGPLEGGTGELVILVVLGAWVAVGTSHATAAVMRRVGLTGGSDDH
jgi:hypothetical protein